MSKQGYEYLWLLQWLKLRLKFDAWYKGILDVYLRRLEKVYPLISYQQITDNNIKHLFYICANMDQPNAKFVNNFGESKGNNNKILTRSVRRQMNWTQKRNRLEMEDRYSMMYWLRKQTYWQRDLRQVICASVFSYEKIRIPTEPTFQSYY